MSAEKKPLAEKVARDHHNSCRFIARKQGRKRNAQNKGDIGKLTAQQGRHLVAQPEHRSEESKAPQQTAQRRLHAAQPESMGEAFREVHCH